MGVHAQAFESDTNQEMIVYQVRNSSIPVAKLTSPQRQETPFRPRVSQPKKIMYFVVSLKQILLQDNLYTAMMKTLLEAADAGQLQFIQQLCGSTKVAFRVSLLVDQVPALEELEQLVEEAEGQFTVATKVMLVQLKEIDSALRAFMHFTTHSTQWPCFCIHMPNEQYPGAYVLELVRTHGVEEKTEQGLDALLKLHQQSIISVTA